MYEVFTTYDARVLMRSANEADALHEAVQHATQTGEYTIVRFGDPDSDIGMHEVWRVEPDTKVNEDDPSWPAIVHQGALQHLAREATA